MRTSLPFILFFHILGCSDPAGRSNNINDNINNINNVNNLNNQSDAGQDIPDVDLVEDAADDTGDGSVEPVPCTVDDTLANVPPFSYPPEEDWNHSIISATTAASGSPGHMMHDEMVPENTPVIVTAKFDYNSALHKDLQDEWILVYLWGTGRSDWELLGRYLTDTDGKIQIQVGGLGAGTYMLRGVVAGDLTEAVGYVTVIGTNRQAVVFDIDGTLTTSDAEVMQDWAGFTTAEMYPYADLVVQYYVDHGFHVAMVTGRPYWLAVETRQWLADHSMPFHSIRFTSDNGTTVSGQETQAYKTGYLEGLIATCGLDIVRAYGNSDTDVWAYDAVGVSKTQTFIIGDIAGMEQTQPIVCEGCGYQSHYEDFLLSDTLTCLED
ncbi:haloacid dehalogenase [Myxococcota bacterium]|nr:haloacid dehalogenase [Myxococcota bacterium]